MFFKVIKPRSSASRDNPLFLVTWFSPNVTAFFIKPVQRLQNKSIGRMETYMRLRSHDRSIPSLVPYSIIGSNHRSSPH